MLDSINYLEFSDQDSEWVLEGFSLGKTNLLVGRNATGKSRTINVIAFLARILSGKKKEVGIDGNFDVHFTFVDIKYHYNLEFNNFQVVREDLL